MIWRLGTNHNKRSPECDCYFDLLDGNFNFIKKKNYPENSTCILPDFNKKNQSRRNSREEEEEEEQEQEKEIDQFNSNDVFNLPNNNNNDNYQQEDQNTENINSKYISYNTFKSIPNIYTLESIRTDINFVSNQINQAHEDNNFIFNKISTLEQKINRIETNQKLISEEQQKIFQNINIITLLILNRDEQQTTNRDILNSLDDNIQTNSLDTTLEPLNLSIKK